MDFYSFSVKGIDGKPVAMSQFRDKVVLVVNVASRCGFTPQYKGLEELYRSYKDRGFVVLGFPCNQFGAQEPGDESEIQSFCELNFGVTFPLLGKIEVNGEGADPLYKYLTSARRGVLGTRAIKWNFTKFLIDRKGEPARRFAPNIKPESIATAIEKVL